MQATIEKMAKILVNQQNELNKLNSVIDSILQNMNLSVNDIESKYQFC